jgi:hypothetical protein
MFGINSLVLASGHQGLKKIYEVRQNDNPLRIMDPDNDIYPAPLMTSQPSYKHQGFSKLQMAVTYLQYKRLIKLIEEHQDDYKRITYDHVVKKNYTNKEKLKELLSTHNYCYDSLELTDNLIDIYTKMGPYGNILNKICGANSGANIMHSGNEMLFDRVFMGIIKTLKEENLPHMLSNPFKENWNYIQKHCYLYGIIILNYGGKVKNVEDFVDNLEDDYAKGFYKSNKLEMIYKSELPPGKKLFSICKVECPITLEPIDEPVFLEDGTVYEKTAILKWFDGTRNTSPLTGLKLNTFWRMYDLNSNEIIYGNNQCEFPEEIQRYIK